MNKLEEITKQMLTGERQWSGETCCMKKYPRGDEKPSFMGYVAFGVVTRPGAPVVIYLREDFVRTMEYATVDEAILAGWVVD